MFGKTLLKSMAGTAAVGTVLSGAALAAPAASSLAPMSCKAQYQHSVVTHTRLTMNRRSAEFGTRNAAHVMVTSDSGQVPTGRVRISTSKRTWTVPLDASGTARHRMLRWLPPGNYPVTAQYLPGCSAFGRSHAARHFYTVFEAHTQVVHLHARNIARGRQARVRLDVTSSTGVTPPGRVKIELFHHSRMRRSRVVRLHGGHAFVRMGKVWSRHNWQVTATYLGTHHFLRAQSDTTFWVRRRR